MISNYDPIRKLIDELKRLPGVGEKTAQRLAYFIVGMNRRDAEGISGAIVEVKDKIMVCSICYNFERSDPCPICSDPKRDNTTICVIEDPRDLVAVEGGTSFKGLYHVLHGVISPISGIGPDELRIDELKRRIERGGVMEVIIATNPTKEGEITARYIQDRISGLGVRVTRIAQGVPAGGDLEYFDPQTLSAALANRREL